MEDMTGTITISVEIELGWGVHQVSSQEPADRLSPCRKRETNALRNLLAVCDDYGIPISFNVVGHLLLESCSGHHDGPHERDWFGSDPGGDINSHPFFYAPDLIRRIQEAEVDHEICTHTFSHVPSHITGPEVLDWELQKVTRLHTAAGLSSPRSFVPPIHAPPPYDVLERNGIETVRLPVKYEPPVGTRDSPKIGILKHVQRLRHSHPAQVLFRSHPIRDPQSNRGLTETVTTWHASLTAPYLPNGQAQPHPFYRAIPTVIRQRTHSRYLRHSVSAVMTQHGYAHFWTHLFNIANDAQWPPVKSFFERVGRRQNRGEITLATMESLSNNVSQNDS